MGHVEVNDFTLLRRGRPSKGHTLALRFDVTADLHGAMAYRRNALTGARTWTHSSDLGAGSWRGQLAVGPAVFESRRAQIRSAWLSGFRLVERFILPGEPGKGRSPQPPPQPSEKLPEACQAQGSGSWPRTARRRRGAGSRPSLGCSGGEGSSYDELSGGGSGSSGGSPDSVPSS
jgi:hypothetical protein